MLRYMTEDDKVFDDETDAINYQRVLAEQKINDIKEDLFEAIVDGASQRIRPMLMTSLASFIGLLPILWSTGAGADVMKRIAAPMVGGIASSLFIVLLVFPAVYSYWKGWK